MVEDPAGELQVFLQTFDGEASHTEEDWNDISNTTIHEPDKFCEILKKHLSYEVDSFPKLKNLIGEVLRYYLDYPENGWPDLDMEDLTFHESITPEFIVKSIYKTFYSG